MLRNQLRRTAGLLATVVIAAAIAFVLLNRGAASGPGEPARLVADSPAGSGVGARPATQDQPTRPLVERVLDGLRDGRPAKSFDNPAAGASVPAVQVESNVAVGRISVAAMELRSPFYEGVHDAVIDNGPGHWPGTPLPGQAGNAVLSGHRTTHGAEFFDLDALRPGNKIEVQVGGPDQSLTYVVRGTRIVKESRYVREVTRQPTDQAARVLTLFACDPVYDSTHRIVVRAEAAPLPEGEGG